MIVKLDFDTFKDGRVGNKKVIGMRYNYKDIYSLIGKYNAYTVEITESGETVYFDTSSDYYYNDLDTYFNMGDGSRFYNNIPSYTYTTPGIYQIITSARIDKTKSSPDVIAVNGIRRDTISLENAFNRYDYTKEFNPQNLKTNRVTTMKKMFYNCWYNPHRIQEETGISDGTVVVDFSKWDTSNVTDMSWMFGSAETTSVSRRCTFMPSALDTSNVVNMSCMFKNYECTREIDFSYWDTSKVTDMSEMFYNIYQYVLDIGNWDVSNVTTFKNMFYDSGFRCESYYFDENNVPVYIPPNLSKWDTSSATDMSGMFYNCNKLASLDLGNWKVHNVRDMSYMFYGCYGLQSIDLSNWDTGNVTNISYMFYSCSELQSLDLSGWDVSNVTDMNYVFAFCHKLTELRLVDCSLSTIETIINWLPTNPVDGERRTIYCDRRYEGQLTKPNNWTFSYID